MFENCTALTGIIIPNSVTSIGDSAFLNTALTSIIIPNRVTHIGLWAFFGCKDLKSITIPDSVTYIGRLAFRDCHLDLVIKAPAGSVAETYAKDNNIKFESNTAPTKRALGDVTGDGKVTSGDAIAVLRAEAQLKKLTAVEFTAADVVKDGRVTSGDAIRILRYEAQLIPSL
ncbi:MAG: leucine-rich repeat protein [Oscillospiraceae bacterium]